MGTVLNRNQFRINLLSVIFMLIGISMITPFIFMISAALKTNAQVFTNPLQIIPESVYWGNFQFVIGHQYFGTWYRNTVLVVISVILLKAFCITLAAYAFARLSFPLKNVLFMICFSMWMIPPDVTIVSRYFFYRELHILDTMLSLILPAVFDVFMLFLIRQFFIKIPTSLSEAAFVEGASHFRVYWNIILPLSKPVLITMTLFTFIWTWNSYLEPLVFIISQRKQVITVGLQYFQEMGGANIAAQFAGATLGTFPPIILFAFGQNYFVEGIASTGIKG